MAVDPATAMMITDAAQKKAGSAAALFGEGYRYIEGRKQVKQGKEILKKARRPTLEIPQATQDAYASAKYNAATNSNNLRAETERSIGSANAASIAAGKQVGDPSAMLAYLTAVDTNNKNSLASSALSATQQKAQDLMNLQQEAARYSQFEQKNWEWNKQKPWQDAMVASSALIKAGKENTFNAINNMAKFAAGSDISKDSQRPIADSTNSNSNSTNNVTPTTIDPSMMSDNDFVKWVQSADMSTMTDEQIQRATALGILK